MRQVIKKTIAVICVLCLIFTQFEFHVDAKESKGERLKQKYKNDESIENEKNKKVMALNEKIDKNYAKRKKIKEKVKKDKKINSKYAGEYFDKEGNYVIMIAENMDVIENSDVYECAENNNIEIVEAKYTYNELEEMYNIYSEKYNELLALYNNNINKLTLEEREAISCVQGYGIDEINNCIVVDCSTMEYVECLKK